jgi:alkylated DNA nucleotide flippase Atl1
VAKTRERGVVTGLLVKPGRGMPMDARTAVAVRSRRGMLDDCHAQPLGPRQVLIVREEELVDLGLAAWQVRANIAVAGLTSDALASGVVLRFGDEVRVRITHECEICKILRRYVPGEVFSRLPGRRGSLGVYLAGGTLELGATVVSEDDRYPDVPERVYERVAWVISRVPAGRVVTYDRLLELVGASKPFFRVLPTYVKRSAVTGLPAHRVLTTAGRLNGHLARQREHLYREGVQFDPDGRLLDASRRWSGQTLYFQRR